MSEIKPVDVVRQWFVDHGYGGELGEVKYYNSDVVDPDQFSFGGYHIYCDGGDCVVLFGHHGYIDFSMGDPNFFDELWDFVKDRHR